MRWIFEKTETDPPPPSSAYANLLENSYSQAHAVSAALSYVIYEKRHLVGRQQQSASELVEAARPMSKLILNTYQEIEFTQADHKSQLRDKLRVSLFGILAPQLITIPALFRYPKNDLNAQHERKNMMTGLYGSLVGFGYILYKAHLEATKMHTKESGQRTAAIHELTLMGLVNRFEDGRQCALPTLAYDRKLGCDVEYFAYPPHAAEEAQGARTFITASSAAVMAKKPNSPDTVKVSGNFLGTQPYAEPWNSLLPFETLAAMHNELEGLGAINLGPNRISSTEGLDQIQSNLIQKITPALESY